MMQKALEEYMRNMKLGTKFLHHVAGDLPVNKHIIDVLPADTRVVAANLYGECNVWFASGRIDAILAHGQSVQYFVKYAAGTRARNLLASEYFSTEKLHEAIPDSSPKPIGWGSLGTTSNLEGFFILLEFISFSKNELPDVTKTAKLVAALHDAGESSEKNFGSPVPTFDGIFHHVNGWEQSWPALFSKMLSQAFKCDMTTNGYWPELEATYIKVQDAVIPRLLGELENDGRKVKPCFIHGDLWEGNIRTEKDTGKLYIFDSNGYYAHSEMELAYWITEHHRMRKDGYCEAYFQCRKPSNPAHEAKDRIRLYSVKPYLMYSAHSRGHISREKAFEEMQYLVTKYDMPKRLSSTCQLQMYGSQDAVHSKEILDIIELVTAEEFES